MRIRPATAADEQALAAIRRDAILALAGTALSRDQAQDWAAQAAPDRIARALREHAVWLAEEQAPLGWVEVDRDRVAALYVAPACAGQGVGSALLARAEAAIGGSGYTTARLRASPNALGFYLRRGYARCGPRDDGGAYPLRKELGASDLS